MQQNTTIALRNCAGPSRSVRASGARYLLRTHTLDLHTRAEEVLGSDSCRSLVGYIGMLQSNLSVTETVYRATAPLLPPDMRENLAVDMRRLRQDLAELDVRPFDDDADLELHESAGAIGAMYVLEGARLGGRLLARRVEAELGLTAGRGAAYLNGDGADTGRRWRRFLIELEERLVSPEDLERALLGARATFSLVIRRYERLAG